MKLYEILKEDELNELNLKKAVAAGTLAAASLIPQVGQKDDISHTNIPQKPEVQKSAVQKSPQGAEKLISLISKTNNIPEERAAEIVNLAFKYEKPIFPKARDILSVINIESHFDPSVISGLKHDPAVGLMQTRPRCLGIRCQ